MHVLNDEIAVQQEHNKRIREILISVKNQKAHIAEEINNLQTVMIHKEEGSNKELNVLQESIAHGLSTVSGLKEAVKKEVLRQKHIAQDKQDLRDRADELENIQNDLNRGNDNYRKQL